MDRQVVGRAISALASVCDRAVARDGEGFSKSTAGPGHELAALGSERWSPEMWTYAARVASHHAAQLTDARVLTDGEAEALRAAARGRMKSPPLPSGWVDAVDTERGPMLVYCEPSHLKLSRPLKRLGPDEAYRPSGSGRLWRISERFAFVLAASSDTLDILSSRARAIISSSLERASRQDRALAHPGPLVRDSKDGLYFDHPFHSFLHAAVKDGAGHFSKGANWDECEWFARAENEGALVATLIELGADVEYESPEVFGRVMDAFDREDPDLRIEQDYGDSVRLRFTPSSPLVAAVMSDLAELGFRHAGPGQWVASERALPALAAALAPLESEWTVRAVDALTTAFPALQDEEKPLPNAFRP